MYWKQGISASSMFFLWLHINKTILYQENIVWTKPENLYQCLSNQYLSKC